MSSSSEGLSPSRSSKVKIQILHYYYDCLGICDKGRYLIKFSRNFVMFILFRTTNIFVYIDLILLNKTRPYYLSFVQEGFLAISHSLLLLDLKSTAKGSKYL